MSYVNKLNDNGGVNGPKINLSMFDDAYTQRHQPPSRLHANGGQRML
jgi:hypothetical protein